ncbi:unnamed protein product [Sphenostylis stenocarpa]|uniref:Uncharacterized protein n=1 Tax=Sphenostylis stenocarpa TaxID=92480 RepID=A0AA86SZN7_9FABA|nr:unnamed protein product [Sphenostylis stenocarpa]
MTREYIPIGSKAFNEVFRRVGNDNLIQQETSTIASLFHQVNANVSFLKEVLKRASQVHLRRLRDQVVRSRWGDDWWRVRRGTPDGTATSYSTECRCPSQDNENVGSCHAATDYLPAMEANYGIILCWIPPIRVDGAD